MSREIKLLKKNFSSMSKQEIFTSIRQYRNQLDLKLDTRKTVEFAYIILDVIDYFSQKDDINSERILLNQLVEIAWWAEEFSELITILSRSIYKIMVDSHSVRGQLRNEIFNDLLEILVRFPENKTIYDSISRAAIELIKWGEDKEILELIEILKEKVFLYPLVNSLQILDVKIYMNALFYLSDQDHNTILKIYNEFSCFSLSTYVDSKESECNVSKLLLGEDVNEILQEGAINAIINIARINHNSEEKCQDCIESIRKIIQDSEYLLRKDEEHFYKDVYRLSYAFDQFNLWDKFLDLPIISELKEERDKNEIYEIADSKLLAIQKNMRIEEYDALKIGRRGIILSYDFNDIEDIKRLTNDFLNKKQTEKLPIKLVEEIDAIIDPDYQIKEHLRETGQIPIDRKTVDELQDITTKSDDLTKAATKEEKISEQIQYLKNLELNDKLLINQIMYTKALIFGVAMFGFNSPILNISQEEVIDYVEILSEKKIIMELIEPLTRAVTLRAARLDGESTVVLFQLLNRKGLKFISKYYKIYNFIDNITRLISFLGRRGEIELLKSIKLQLETANRISLKEEDIPLKIARAINESILSYTASDKLKKYVLVELLKELANKHSYDVNLQIKYIEGMNFLIFTECFNDCKKAQEIIYDLSDFSKSFQRNQNIEEKAALGLLWFLIICQNNSFMKNKIKFYQKEIVFMASNYTESKYLQNIKQLSENLLEK